MLCDNYIDKHRYQRNRLSVINAERDQFAAAIDQLDKLIPAIDDLQLEKRGLGVDLPALKALTFGVCKGTAGNLPRRRHP
jgi:hypothetical protein